MIIVILAHSQVPWKLFEFVSFIIVVFPFLSGYLHNSKSLGELFSKRLPLLSSYYYIGAINYLIWVFFVGKEFKKVENLTYLWNFLLVNTDKLDNIPLNIVPLWYLVFLFSAEMLYYISRKLKITIPVIMLGIISRLYFPGSLPFKIDVAFASIYMFELGRVFNQKRIEIKNYLGLATLLIWIFVALLNGGTSWNFDEYGKNAVVSIFGEIACVLSIVWIAQFVEKKDKLKSVLGKIFKQISDDAIFILGYHILFGGILMLLLSRFGFNITEKHLKNYWYITFSAVFFSTYAAINLLPKKVKILLSQPMSIKNLL